MENALEFRNVKKIFKTPSILFWKKSQKKEALNSATFKCPQGQITCLLGPNGAGKTTIIKIIAGLVSADKGDVVMKELKTGDIGLVTPNDRSFYWRLTGWQNLDFFAALHGLKGKTKKNRVSDVLNDVGMYDEKDKPFRQYSSGMKQKMILARALLGNPKLLLLDEPTAHIDPPSRKQFYQLVTENFIKKRGATVLLCTHDLFEATELAQHIILLHQGKVIEEGDLEHIQKKFTSSYTLVIDFLSPPQEPFDKKYKDRIKTKSASSMELAVAEKSMIPGILEDFLAMKGQLMGARTKEDSLYELFDLIEERIS